MGVSRWLEESLADFCLQISGYELGIYHCIFEVTGRGDLLIQKQKTHTGYKS